METEVSRFQISAPKSNSTGGIFTNRAIFFLLIKTFSKTGKFFLCVSKLPFFIKIKQTETYFKHIRNRLQGDRIFHVTNLKEVIKFAEPKSKIGALNRKYRELD